MSLEVDSDMHDKCANECNKHQEALKKIASAMEEVNGNRRFTLVDCVAIAKEALDGQST